MYVHIVRMLSMLYSHGEYANFYQHKWDVHLTESVLQRTTKMWLLVKWDQIDHTFNT